MNDPIEIPSRTGGPVWVGTGILERTAELAATGAARAAVIFDESIPPEYADAVTGSLTAAGAECIRAALPSGEQAKSLEVAGRVAETLAEEGLHRGDFVVGLGGGAATDLAGFVAATYHRGVEWCAVPTTLLGMIDAAIGGKTAVNLPQGKNLLGAFHAPACVVADVATLVTLDEAEFRSGMAEVIKHGLIGDPGILRDVRDARVPLDRRDPTALVPLVARAARVKVGVVDADPTERGVRAHLNYGHTLGHALETLGQTGGGPPRRHGEAVAIGMMFAAHLAARTGLKDLIAEHRIPIEAAGLPAGDAGIPFPVVHAMMLRDKKWQRGIRFVLLEDLGVPRLVSGIEDVVLEAAYEDVR